MRKLSTVVLILLLCSVWVAIGNIELVKAENTNIWQTQTFGTDPLFPIVLIAITLGAVLANFLRTNIKK